jgi:hypothetical protein
MRRGAALRHLDGGATGLTSGVVDVLFSGLFGLIGVIVGGGITAESQRRLRAKEREDHKLARRIDAIDTVWSTYLAWQQGGANVAEVLRSGKTIPEERRLDFADDFGLRTQAFSQAITKAQILLHEEFIPAVKDVETKFVKAGV